MSFLNNADVAKQIIGEIFKSSSEKAIDGAIVDAIQTKADSELAQRVSSTVSDIMKAGSNITRDVAFKQALAEEEAMAKFAQKMREYRRR